MIQKCRFFQCRDQGNCPEGDHNCAGCGGAAYQNCGCDACVNQSLHGDGDAVICEVALALREEEMEEMEGLVMEEKLMKILCDALHYTFDEEACVSTLDLKKTVANLIANGVTVPAWRLASDPPKDTHDYWVAYKVNGQYVYTNGYYDGRGWKTSSADRPLPVTHWMPLPKPPKEG